MIHSNKIVAAAGLVGSLLLAGCQSAGTVSNTSDRTANSSANATAASSPAAGNPDAVRQPSAPDSPTVAYEAAYTARKNKDTEALKKLMSKDVLEFLTMIGQADPKKKQTLDQILMEMCESPQAERPDTRNEKIDGEKASVEYLDETGAWQLMAFVKEEGAWKLTIDGPEPGAPVANSHSNTNK